jgi:hypothetical protein
VSTTCPAGHNTTATDYCDTCGAPVQSTAEAAVPAAVPSTSSAPAPPTPVPTQAQDCPHCGTANVVGALFCEACGYDFTTGAAPRTAPAATGATGPGPLAPAMPVEWVLERWVDPEWHAQQEHAAPCPSPGLPVVVPLAVRSLLVGRPSRSRAITPDVDCTPDEAVSRRQAQLSTDGSRWWVEDLQSSNGTFVAEDGRPLPSRPLAPGMRHELHEGDRVYVGAWTRLVLRRATDDERAGRF